MAIVTAQKPGYEDRFHFSPSDAKPFDSAQLIHDEYKLYNNTPMARGQELSCLSKFWLRDRTISLSTIGAAPYDRSALSICLKEFQSLNGERRSDILLIVEHPLAIIPDNCGPALPDRIVRAVGTQSGLRVVESDSSLASTSIIERAIEVAIQRGYTAEAVLGVVIHSVALNLNSRCNTDVAEGVHSVAKMLGQHVNILSLYEDAHRVSSYSPHQLTTLQAELRRAAVAADLATDEKSAKKVNLFVRENLLSVLYQIPQRGNDILGLLACQAAPDRVVPRTIEAVPACYQAWGGRFSAAQLHESVLLMAKHLTHNTPGSDWGSAPLIHHIKRIVNDARYEAVGRCVDLVIPLTHVPSRIVVVADPTTAHYFNGSIIERLR